jgi:hypothetical protein
MQGLWTYDLHDSEMYRDRFGLNAEVPAAYKRRMNTAEHAASGQVAARPARSLPVSSVGSASQVGGWNIRGIPPAVAAEGGEATQVFGQPAPGVRLAAAAGQQVVLIQPANGAANAGGQQVSVIFATQ